MCWSQKTALKDGIWLIWSQFIQIDSISVYTPTCLYICNSAIKFLFLTDAYETAKLLCEQYYLVAPELEVEEFNGKRQSILDEIRWGQGGMA